MFNNGWGLVPWGTGIYGIPHPSEPPTNAFVNIINVIPTPGSFNIQRNQTFTFTIQSRFAINPNTTYIFLDNKVVINGTYVNTTDFSINVSTNIDGISKDYIITPNYLFKNRDVFTLQISSTDIYGNPSRPFWGGYVVLDSRPPLITPIYPLDGYINVPIDLTIHFLINQLAAPSNGLDVSTLNVSINSLPAIINGVIQSAFGGDYSAINLPQSITDITTPFEILLDANNQYSANDIVVINVDIKERGIIPVIGNGNIYNQKNVLVAHNVAVNTVNKISSAQYDLILNAALQTYVLDGYIISGFTFIDSAGNSFRIGNVGVQELIINTIANRRFGSFSFITGQIQQSYDRPVFAGYFQGVYLVADLGDGYRTKITWHPARTTRPDQDLAYLIYYSTTRLDVFDGDPKIITQGRVLPAPETIHGADAQLFGYYAEIPLPVGITYYFAVRATEYPHTTPSYIPVDGYNKTTSNGLTIIDGYSFSIPAIQGLLTSTAGIGAISINVITTKGYLISGGYIIVGSEIMRYASLTSTSFIVPLIGRGLFGTTVASIHNIGENVGWYFGNHDDNSVIEKGLVSWESPNDPHRTRPDLITTDFTMEDAGHVTFEPFDFCGYHRFRPDELLSDEQCGTYVGGQFNGHRGLFLYDRMLGQEESLLEVTGEPTILLRRLWSGETCICRTSRKDISRVRSCSICFGTGFRHGYVQYFNPRRDDQRIMVHLAVNDEEVAMKAQAGWDQTFNPMAWTIPIPTIKDRDVLIKFNEYKELEWMYEISSVSRAQTMFNRYGRQKMKLNRLDRTNVVYQFSFVV